MNKKTIVIVLGNRLNDDGTMTKILEERLSYTMEIEKLFKPSYYILSGGPANPLAGLTEAEAMYNYLVSQGFEKEKLIIEKESLTTFQNAANSVPIAKEMGAEVIIVCTSAYHLGDPRYKAMESFVNELKDTNITLMTYCR
ncbi:MAG: YdcF family protein [Bacilli bacterium]|nr:YdcF family protein [Bacilli bacterium]